MRLVALSTANTIIVNIKSANRFGSVVCVIQPLNLICFSRAPGSLLCQLLLLKAIGHVGPMLWHLVFWTWSLFRPHARVSSRGDVGRHDFNHRSFL
jgi:hypothetical protein